MDNSLTEMFLKVLKFIEKEDNCGLALVAFFRRLSELMRLDPEHANEQIDSATNGLISNDKEKTSQTQISRGDRDRRNLH